MSAVRASWGDESQRIQSVADLDGIIRGIQDGRVPTLVILENDAGGSLSFGVGRDESVLGWHEPDGTSFHSLGSDRYRKGRIEFMFRGEINECSLECAIPASTAIEAAREFVRTGQRPGGVTWEGDW